MQLIRFEIKAGLTLHDFDTDVVTSCSVRPSAIPSFMILKIGGNSRMS